MIFQEVFQLNLIFHLFLKTLQDEILLPIFSYTFITVIANHGERKVDPISCIVQLGSYLEEKKIARFMLYLKF